MSPAPDEPRFGAIRFETAIAALVGVLALLVSAFTAYVQRQQVRARVLPILRGGFGNMPNFRVVIVNKGAGPAILRHVMVTVDDAPMASW